MKKIITAFLIACAGTAFANPLQTALMQAAKSAQESQPKINVACELETDGKYVLTPSEACRKDPTAQKEVELLEKFLIDLADRSGNTTYETKHLGTVNLSEQIYQQTFLVNHSWRAITERFMGFGPEDDKQFDYKNPGFYPNGTIKVNLTERAFDVIRLYDETIVPQYGIDSVEAKGLRGFLGMVFFHEVMHGWQLHTQPVLDYKRMDQTVLQEMLKLRQPDDELVKGSQKIVDYEEDANVFTYHYMASIYSDFAAFVKAFEQLSQDPAFFVKYPRLTDANDTFYQYYLVNQLKGAKEVLDEINSGKKLDTFNELNTYTYRGQVAPLQAWAFMVRVNNRLVSKPKFTKKRRCKKEEENVRKAYDSFMDLAEPTWNGRTEDNEHDRIIMDTIKSIEEGYPGLPEIKQAARQEFKTFEETCNVTL